MPDKLQTQLLDFGQSVLQYLPNLLGGLVLLAIGWFLGWFAKRVVMQLAVLLRLERFLTSFRWGEDFAKADVRYGFYSFLGNVAFLIVFLIFADNAVRAWRLTTLSDLLNRGVYYFPQIILALAIFGVGWLIAFWSSRAVQRALRRESIPRATLVSRFVRAVLLLLFSAMSLVELDIAREVVIIGFATIFITLGVLSVVITAIGGKEFIQKIQQSLEDE